MSKPGNKIPTIIIFTLIGIIVGIQIQNMLQKKYFNDNLKKFSHVLNFVEDNYVDSVKTDELIESSITGMFEKLDPHTVYIPSIMQNAIEEEINGMFEGIGVEFQIINDTITVVSPITGGPSEAVGVEAGDRIIRIDGEECFGFSNTDVMKKLKGEKGSEVNILVYRPLANTEMNFDIIRDEIPIHSVDAALMYNDSIAYINLTRFAETSYDEMFTELNRLKSDGMKRLILDLRNNPGGLLTQAYKISDLFISDNKLIVYTRGRLSKFDDDLNASVASPYEDIPLVILLNRGSASASEIVAGAVQDWDRALLVGETSYGKGLVQRPLILDDNSAVRVTISKYYTPSGRAIQRDYSDKKEYLNHDREMEGESNNYNHTAEFDSTKPIFKTSGGRNVYGGGGITPDYIIDSGNITDYSIKLRRKNVYYQYIRKFMDKNGKHIRKLYDGNLRQFKKTFKFSDSDINDFIDFAAKRGVEFVAKDFRSDQNYIRARLRAYISREIWRNEGWYLAILDQDDQFNKALDLISSDAMFDTIDRNLDNR